MWQRRELLLRSELTDEARLASSRRIDRHRQKAHGARISHSGRRGVQLRRLMQTA
jgi:hypothetical protein